jgi:hypothetical protein
MLKLQPDIIKIVPADPVMLSGAKHLDGCPKDPSLSLRVTAQVYSPPGGENIPEQACSPIML